MDATSLDQMNKLRKSLGLPLLPTPNADSNGPSFKQHDPSDEEDEPASTLERREAAGFENFQRLQEQQSAAKRREEQRAAIARARDAALRDKKLEGKGLGDLDEGDLDAKTWLKGQNKRQKKIQQAAQERLARELEERERLAAVEYSSKDLAGIKIGHEIADFGEGEGEQVLTLKDTTIGDDEDEDDELENADLVSKAKLEEKLKLKKKRPVYDPNAVDEDGEGKILAQYDEEIDGKKRKRFVLDGSGEAMHVDRDTKRQAVDGKTRVPISLDIFQEEPKSDYMDISEIKIRKAKKPKKSRQKPVEDAIFPELSQTVDHSMDVDHQPASMPPEPRAAESAIIDDEDLQLSLAASRRAAFQKRKRMKPDDLARQLQEQAEDEERQDDAEEPGLVIDETSAFVDNLQAKRPEANPNSTAKPSTAVKPGIAGPADEDGDTNMYESYGGIEDEEELLARLKREQNRHTPEVSGTGLEAEATVDQGLGATLNLLKQRGLVKVTDSADLNALHRDRAKFLQSRHIREAEAEQKARLQRERDRASGKLANLSNREKEHAAQWSNQQRDQMESRQIAELFNQAYKPDVNLTYTDDMGRTLNQKEAFKHLSHQFHGKGSGKQKTEKRLKKIEDEKKREAMSALDSSQATGMNNAMGTTQRKNKTAGVRLA